MLRIRAPRPQYWKLENLEDFDGERWVGRGVPDQFGPGPEADLDENCGRAPAVERRGARHRPRPARRPVRGRRHDARGRRRARGEATPTFSPGTWQADHELAAGDSYRVPSTRRGRTRSSSPPRRAARAASRATRSTCCCRCSSPSCPRPASAAGPSPRSSSSRRRSRSTRPPLAAERAPRDDRARHPRAAQLVVPADVAARAAAQARRPQPLRVRPPHRPLPRPRLPLRRAAGARAGGRAAARALPVRGQGRLLPALLGRDGAAAAHGRRARARGDRLLARRLPPPPGRVGGARPRRPLLGRGVVRRHRLGDVRPDAERDARALADRLDQRARPSRRADGAADDAAIGPRPHAQPGRRAPGARPARLERDGGGHRRRRRAGAVAVRRRRPRAARRAGRARAVAPRAPASGPARPGGPRDRRPRRRAAARRAARPAGRHADRARAPARRRRLPVRAALRPLRAHRERARRPTSGARSAASSPRGSAGAGACARGGRCRRRGAESSCPHADRRRHPALAHAGGQRTRAGEAPRRRSRAPSRVRRGRAARAAERGRARSRPPPGTTATARWPARPRCAPPPRATSSGAACRPRRTRSSWRPAASRSSSACWRCCRATSCSRARRGSATRRRRRSPASA